MRAAAALLAFVTGCAAPCEQDATVDSVLARSSRALTATQVLNELTAFASWTSRPVCVSAVEIRRPARRGLVPTPAWVTTDGTLVLDDLAGLPELRSAVCRHVDRGTSASAALLDRDRFEANVPIEQWSRYRTEPERRAATFAAMCEFGPDLFGAMDSLYVDRCGGAHLQQEVVRWLHEEVFDEAALPVTPARLVRGPVVRWRKPDNLQFDQRLAWVDGAWLLNGIIIDPTGDGAQGLAVVSTAEAWTLVPESLGAYPKVSSAVATKHTALVTLLANDVLTADKHESLAVLDPATRTLTPLDLPGEIGVKRATDDRFFVQHDPRGDGEWGTLALDPSGAVLAPLPTDTWWSSVATGDHAIEWQGGSFLGASGLDLVRRAGSASMTEAPAQLAVTDTTGRLPVRRTLAPTQLLRVGDDMWALHERPDGRLALVVVDAAGDQHLVVDPCTVLRGELELLDGQPWDVWDEGPWLSGQALSWEAL